MGIDGGAVSLRGRSGVEFGTGRADEDKEHDKLGEPGPALVEVEDLHAEGGHEPADEGNDDDADDYGYAVGGDGGENLAADDAVDYAVAEEEDDLERGLLLKVLLFSHRV